MDNTQERYDKARRELEENLRKTRLALRKKVEAIAGHEHVEIPDAIKGVIYRDKEVA